jgi:uridine kinase
MVIILIYCYHIMKIAILISGFLRTFSFNKDKIYNLFKQYHPDYFLHISTEEYNDNYINISNNLNDIISLLNPVQILYEKELDFKNENMKKMWYKFYILNNIKNIYQKNNNINYDIIIRIRPDILILDDTINLIKNEHNIYGINDEFFYGSNDKINEIANIFIDFNTICKNNICFKKGDIFLEYLKIKKLQLINHNINYKLILSLCNMIAISGDSGSGKSTLMNYLQNIFIDNVVKLEGDRYHKWERGNPNWKIYTHLNPNANYLSKFKDDIFNLKIGNTIYQVDYDHKSGTFTNNQKIESSDNIILCGLHTLYDNNLNKMYNLKIFLDTDYKIKYYWKLIRDIKERGYSKDIVLLNINRRLNDNIKYIECQKYNADIIINFFTDEEFDYHNLDNEPNIYLKLIIKKNINNFIKLLNDHNVNYELIINDKIELIFKSIQDNFKYIYKYFNLKDELDYCNYYTIIISLIYFFNL